jgi:FkbM family methyltransferase
MIKIGVVTTIIKVVDYFYKLKIRFFLKTLNKKFDILFDIGAHHGESIFFFLRTFNIKNIFSFEPSPVNFEILQKKYLIYQRKFSDSKIVIENLGLSNSIGKNFLKQFKESSSSTLEKINNNSVYYKNKNKMLYSRNDKRPFKKIKVRITTLQNYLKKNKIKKIDFLKIDTEGHEFKVLLGLKNYISKVNFIMFEHHYDNMIIKDYNFSKINNFLLKNNFKKIFKAKMPLRKTFEYIYENNKYQK